MKVPIINGIFLNNQPDFQVSYPVGLVPTIGNTGINTGYLKPHEGIVELNTGPGLDRGGIERLGVHYRVMGTKLVSIDASGTPTELGDIPGTGQVAFRPQSSYSFDLLAIVADGKLYYYNASGGDLTFDVGQPSEITLLADSVFEVADPNLGTPIDCVFLNGVFVVTDGEVVRSSSITNPTVFNIASYESSEFDPDPVVAVLRSRSELYVLNRRTIEVFEGVVTGGDIYLPFASIQGAETTKGCVGTLACCVTSDSIAFVGSGHNEPVSVYIARASQYAEVATNTIKTLLSSYTEAELASVVMENRSHKDYNHLYIHLPDRTIVYDIKASAAFETPVWFQLTSSLTGFSRYQAQRYVYAHGKWFVGNPLSNSISVFDETVSTQRGSNARWQFETTIIYNQGRGGIVHELELVALTGRNTQGSTPTISTCYSNDGENFAPKRAISTGASGNLNKRLVWFQNGYMNHWRIQRFEGDSTAQITIARLESQIEPLVN